MATITVSNTGGNWNSTTTWVGGVVPLSTDDVVFTATSGNLTVNAISTINGFDLTNYLGTITFTSELTVNGDLNLGTGGYTQAGASGITKSGDASITSNGVVFSRRFRFNGTFTTTLNDNLNLSGQIVFQLGGSPNTMTVNGFNIYHTGTFGISGNGGQITGTTKYWYQGAGTTWSNTSNAPSINIDFYIDTVGTLAFNGTAPTGFVFGGSKELKIISGTLDTSGLSALGLNGRIVNLTGSTINNLQIRSSTNTLLADIYTTTLTCFASATGIINGFKIFTSNLTQQTGVSNIQGTTVIEINGTGTWSNAGTGVITNDIVINTPGTFTISGNVRYNTGTLTYVAGTVATAGSTLTMGASTTLNTNGISWNNIQFPSTSSTITLTSDLTSLGTIFIPNVVATTTINGNTVYISGSLSHANANNIVGTTNIVFNGTGSWISGGNASISVPVTINTTGKITFVGSSGGVGTFVIGNILTYLNGEVDASLANLAKTAGTITLDTGPIVWRSLTVAPSIVIFNSDFYCRGLIVGTSGNVTLNGFNIYNYGDLRPVNNIICSGTTNIFLMGSGVWTQNTGTTGIIRNNVTIDTTGKYTVSGSVNYDTGTLRYIKGNVIFDDGSLFRISSSTNFVNAHKISFRNVLVTSGSTLTMNEFFGGSAKQPGRIQASTSTGTYTVVFQDGMEKISHNIRVSGCIVSNRGQLLLTSSRANRGNNTGIRYINSSPNGTEKYNYREMVPVETQAYVYGNSMINDPNMISML